MTPSYRSVKTPSLSMECLLLESKLVKLLRSLFHSGLFSAVDPKVNPSNISASLPLSAGLMMRGGDVSSSPESFDDVDDPEDSWLAADGPEKIPMRKRKLPNGMSIASPRLAYAGKQAGG